MPAKELIAKLAAIIKSDIVRYYAGKFKEAYKEVC
jgi:hypothetical protein